MKANIHQTNRRLRKNGYRTVLDFSNSSSGRIWIVMGVRRIAWVTSNGILMACEFPEFEGGIKRALMN